MGRSQQEEEHEPLQANMENSSSWALSDLSPASWRRASLYAELAACQITQLLDHVILIGPPEPPTSPSLSPSPPWLEIDVQGFGEPRPLLRASSILILPQAVPPDPLGYMPLVVPAWKWHPMEGCPG